MGDDTMNRWGTITQAEAQAARDKGALWAMGYFAVLQIAASGYGRLDTTVRGLAALFGLADFNAVKRVLKTLEQSGFIALKQSAKGTEIKLMRFEPQAFGEPKRSALGKAKQSVRQSKTLTPFPPDPLNPIKDNLNKSNGIKSMSMARAGAQLRDFACGVLQKFENLKTDAEKEVWFKYNRGYLRDILLFCGGDKELAYAVIKACLKRLGPLKGGYRAVCRNIADYREEAEKERRAGE